MANDGREVIELGSFFYPFQLSILNPPELGDIFPTEQRNVQSKFLNKSQESPTGWAKPLSAANFYLLKGHPSVDFYFLEKKHLKWLIELRALSWSLPEEENTEEEWNLKHPSGSLGLCHSINWFCFLPVHLLFAFYPSKEPRWGVPCVSLLFVFFHSRVSRGLLASDVCLDAMPPARQESVVG